MHTSAFETCRIHHNGDYDGDVIITNTDSTSKSIGEKATIETTFAELLKIHKLNFRKNSKNIVILCNSQEDRYNKEIKISFKDLESFIKCALIDRIISKLGSDDHSLLLLRSIAKKLKTRPFSKDYVH